MKQVREAVDLKPCPFCGGKADPEGWASMDCDRVIRTGPACDDCGASADSVEQWNTRALTPLPDDVAAALAELEGSLSRQEVVRGQGIAVVKSADLRLLIDHVRKGG